MNKYSAHADQNPGLSMVNRLALRIAARGTEQEWKPGTKTVHVLRGLVRGVAGPP